MHARRLAALLMVVLVAVAAGAPAAEAKRHPSNRARIHALEKQVKRDRDQRLRMGNIIEALSAQVDELMADKRCTALLAIDPFVFAPVALGESQPTTVGVLTESSNSENPTYWLPVMKSSCAFQD